MVLSIYLWVEWLLISNTPFPRLSGDSCVCKQEREINYRSSQPSSFPRLFPRLWSLWGESVWNQARHPPGIELWLEKFSAFSSTPSPASPSDNWSVPRDVVTELTAITSRGNWLLTGDTLVIQQLTAQLWNIYVCGSVSQSNQRYLDVHSVGVDEHWQANVSAECVHITILYALKYHIIFYVGPRYLRIRVYFSMTTCFSDYSASTLQFTIEKVNGQRRNCSQFSSCQVSADVIFVKQLMFFTITRLFLGNDRDFKVYLIDLREFKQRVFLHLFYRLLTCIHATPFR